MQKIIFYALGTILVLISCRNPDDSRDTVLTPNPHVAQCDSLAAVYDAVYQPTGFVVGVVEGERLIYAKGFGKRNIERQDPVSPTSVFHMASISKALVATAVMQLVEQNSVHLDTPLVHYLPYFRLDDDRYKGITIKHILAHRSGIPDVEDEDDYGWANPEYDAGAVERFVEGLADRSLKFSPGEKRSYSNFAYDILADVIAKVTGSNFERYMKQNIFKPLEMKNSTFLKHRVSRKLAASPHIIDSNTLRYRVSEVYPYHRAHAASSTFHSNIQDMSLLANAIQNGWLFKDRQILRTSSFEQMLSTRLGWNAWEFHGHKAIMSSGSDCGFNSYFLLLPEDSLAVIAMTNCERFPTDQVAKDMMSIFLGLSPVEVRKPVSLDFEKWVLEDGITEALGKFQALVDTLPDSYRLDWDNIWFLGYRAMQQGNYPITISIFDMFASQFPKDSFTYYVLGKTYMLKGQDDLAKIYFQKTLQLNSNHYRARKDLLRVAEN
ncbi:MAG: serine hydrolase [Fidelibacterota bacterium]|nr:MAG: serine hydrolase [Candidatus Neomarinimicrobiota bacterium]